MLRPKRSFPTENQIQTAFFKWAGLKARKYPVLGLLFHPSNGSFKSKASAGLFKALGQKAGIPDVVLPVPIIEKGILFIEFKSESGRLSPTQKEVIAKLQAVGNSVLVTRCWEEAARAVYDHLGIDEEI